jgi:hypothetical protein
VGAIDAFLFGMYLYFGGEFTPKLTKEGTAGLTPVGQREGDTELGRRVQGNDEKVEVVYLLLGGMFSSQDLKSGKTAKVVDCKQWGFKRKSWKGKSSGGWKAVLASIHGAADWLGW